MPKALDIQGQRFGRLVVLHRANTGKSKNVMWVCRCDCGETTTGAASNLGKTKFSCGCLKSESATASLRINRLAKPGLHGMSDTVEWGVWSRMKDRCYRPSHHKYPRYGGRGIKVCDRWLESFENFFEDMGLKPSKRYSLDRIDNDGNYEPANCRWASAATQVRNSTTVHWVTIDNIKLCVVDWAKLLNVPKWKLNEMVRNRGKYKAKFPSIEAAIEHLYNKTKEPPKKKKYRKRYNKNSWAPVKTL